MAFKAQRLSNGMRLVVVPQKNTLAVTVLVLVATGSKYETKEKNGISHLLEHLLFKGTRKRPNQISISEPLDRVGGLYNAFTGDEYTGYYAKVHSAHFDLALDVISDIYLNSKLDEKEIKKEKEVIEEEINMYYDHPMLHVQNLWTKLLYGDQPAGWDIAGTKESLSNISRNDLKQYLKNQYAPSNTILCVSGNMSDMGNMGGINEKKIKEKVQKYFFWTGESKPAGKPKVLEKQESPRVLLHTRKTDQTHFCLGVRGYNIFDPKKYSKEILSIVLGGMMSSRLFVKIREKLSLAYYIKTEANFTTDTGFLAARTGVHNEKAKQAVKAVLDEYKKISKSKIPMTELEKAKEHIKGRLALTLEPSDSKATFYGLQELLENKVLTLEEIYAKIDKVKAEDVLEVAKDLFHPSKLNLALIGPFNKKEDFLNLLNKY